MATKAYNSLQSIRRGEGEADQGRKIKGIKERRRERERKKVQEKIKSLTKIKTKL